MGTKKELEIVQHTTMNYLEIFLLEMFSRQPHGHEDLEIGILLVGTLRLYLETDMYTLQKGDTIVTTSHSSRFPPDIMIGTVESFELNNATYYDVRVKIHTDMAALNNVLVVKYLDAEERETLENSMTIDTESDYN